MYIKIANLSDVQKVSIADGNSFKGPGNSFKGCFSSNVDVERREYPCGYLM